MMNELDEFEWQQRVKKTDRRAFINRWTGKKKIYAFLDFDGVINVMYPPGSPQYERLAKNSGEMDFADPDCVSRFSKLCMDFDIEVIISSSWRYAGIDFCYNYLVKAGMDKRVKVVDVTEDSFTNTREMQITNYLFAHPDYGEYLIFDDIEMDHLQKHQLLCSADQGYTEALDQKARKILKRKGYHPKG